jgi:hypothetical protein
MRQKPSHIGALLEDILGVEFNTFRREVSPTVTLIAELERIVIADRAVFHMAETPRQAVQFAQGPVGVDRVGRRLRPAEDTFWMGQKSAALSLGRFLAARWNTPI